MFQHYGSFAYFLEFVEDNPSTFLFGLLMTTFVGAAVFLRFYNQDEEAASLKHEAENEISVLRSQLDLHAKIMATFTRDIRDALTAIREQQVPADLKKVISKVPLAQVPALSETCFKITSKFNPNGVNGATTNKDEIRAIKNVISELGPSFTAKMVIDKLIEKEISFKVKVGPRKDQLKEITKPVNHWLMNKMLKRGEVEIV